VITAIQFPAPGVWSFSDIAECECL